MTLLTSLTELIKLAEYPDVGNTFYNAGRYHAMKNIINAHAEELIKAVELWETPRYTNGETE